ncbi:hypothetical protein ACWDE9_26580, partial [Streptomyces olivaceoviridis]
MSDERRGGRGQVGGDVAPGALDVFLLLTDRGDIAQRAFGGVVALKAGDDPGGEVVRGQASPGGGDVALGVERLIEDLDAGGDDPRLGDEVGAGGDVVEQAEPGQRRVSATARSASAASFSARAASARATF